MPTLLRIGPYRIFFYSNEGDPLEPPHVHVSAGEKLAKVWLDPVELASSKRLQSKEVAEVRKIVENYQAEFLEAWNAHFDP